MPGVSELYAHLGEPARRGYLKLCAAPGSGSAGQQDKPGMTSPTPVLAGGAKRRFARLDRPSRVLRQGILKLLAIKDSDIRLLILEQCRYAIDQGLHAGGAFSATIPLVALYYGGFLDL